MRISAAAPFAVLLACVALLAAGCGGGSGSTTTRGRPGEEVTGPAKESGGPKKATAPNAPAGSKVVVCMFSGGATAGLRATAVDCGTARATMRRWARQRACAIGKGSSRGSCALGGFRCQAVRSDRGAAVSCARPGGDVAFVAKARPLRKSRGD